MNFASFVPASIFLGAGALGFSLAHLKSRRLASLRLEELDVSEVQAGPCKVLGVIEAPAEPLVAPFTNEPCVYYRVQIDALHGRRWRTVHTEARHIPFRLKDRKGPATVDVVLEGAQVALHAENGTDDRLRIQTWAAGRVSPLLLALGPLRAAVTMLSAGEKVFALGEVKSSLGGAMQLQRGKGPFVLSDQDAGQLGYQVSNAMYVDRFWGGAASALGLWFLYHSV